MYTEEDVDVIFTAAGGSGRGVIEAATDLSDELGRQLWAIGVDTDFLSSSRPSSSTCSRRWSSASTSASSRSSPPTSTAPSRSRRRCGSASPRAAVGYTTSGDHLSAATLAVLRDLEARIVSGEITVESGPKESRGSRVDPLG